MIVKCRCEKIVRISDTMAINWNEKHWCPELVFSFGGHIRRFTLRDVEDVGGILSVLCGDEMEASFCRHQILLKHVIVEGQFGGDFVFELAAGCGDGCMDGDAEVRTFRLNHRESYVVGEALKSRCWQMMEWDVSGEKGLS